MDPKAIFEALQTKFGDQVVFDLHAEPNKDFNPWFFVKRDDIAAVAKHLRDEPQLAFDYLECLSGVDYPDAKQIHVVLHLFSYQHKHRVVLKVQLDREGEAGALPSMTTLSTVWSAANWQERECFDLFGVRFEGHPDLRRLLLPEDWVGYPMRKDYQQEAEYHGIPTTRPNPLTLLSAKPKPVAKPSEPEAKKPEPVAKPSEPEAKKPEPVAKPAEPEVKGPEPVAKASEPEVKSEPEAKKTEGKKDGEAH